MTTTDGVALGKDMTFGVLASDVIPSGSIPHGGNFYASDYTLSLWLDTSSFSSDSTTALFGYYGSSSADSYGSNALYLNADGKLGMGVGALTTSSGAFTQSRGDVTEGSITLSGGLLNITLSVTGASGSQSVNVYINGTLFDTLSYNGNMNGDVTNINSWLNPSLSWGEVKWTNEALGADQVAGFAGLQVPEPAAASLGILGLGVLMMRRRRS